MNPQKQMKAAGIMVMVLGLIHCCATPVIIPGLKALPTSMILACTYMFICTGVAVIFTGGLQFYICRQKETDAKDRKILTASTWFIFLLGVGAVATMWTNPFAYIMLVLAFFEILCLRFLPGKSLLKSMAFC